MFMRPYFFQLPVECDVVYALPDGRASAITYLALTAEARLSGRAQLQTAIKNLWSFRLARDDCLFRQTLSPFDQFSLGSIR